MADPDDEAHLSWKHFVAGMYPVDVVKTHQQASLQPRSSLATARHVYAEGGVRAFFRGVSAIALGAAPAHALYFSVYEAMLRAGTNAQAGDDYRAMASPLRLALAGAVSTLLQDAVMVPMDAVKQRRQLGALHAHHRLEASTWSTLTRVVRAEGLRALYAGYTTTLAMNVPYHAVYFNAYEAIRRSSHVDEGNSFHVGEHLKAGAFAGSLAAALTNPLDVVRTRLQTQGEGEAGARGQYRGLLHASHRIFHEEGPAALTRGLAPRCLFHATSAAVLWSSYEYLKFILGARNDAA